MDGTTFMYQSSIIANIFDFEVAILKIFNSEVQNSSKFNILWYKNNRILKKEQINITQILAKIPVVSVYEL